LNNGFAEQWISDDDRIYDYERKLRVHQNAPDGLVDGFGMPDFDILHGVQSQPTLLRRTAPPSRISQSRKPVNTGLSLRTKRRHTKDRNERGDGVPMLPITSFFRPEAESDDFSEADVNLESGASFSSEDESFTAPASELPPNVRPWYYSDETLCFFPEEGGIPSLGSADNSIAGFLQFYIFIYCFVVAVVVVVHVVPYLMFIKRRCLHGLHSHRLGLHVGFVRLQSSAAAPSETS
jgi:hypothetical protein